MVTTEYIRVVAPATLAENFTFDVLLDGQPFTVVVPPGGVSEGEEFEVPYTRDDDDDRPYRSGQEDCDNSDGEIEKEKDYIPLPPTIGSSSSDEDDQSTDVHDRLGAPYKRFRVSLCSCCDVLTQATFWMSLFCFPVLVAQLLTRLRLKWNGQELPPEKGHDKENATFLTIIMAFIVVLTVGYIPILGTLVLFSFYLFTSVWIGGNLRRHVRQRYRIQRRCSGVEDRCCMCFCCCCSLIQIARHTHDDKDYPGRCCSMTGLESDAPKLLPIYTTDASNNKK